VAVVKILIKDIWVYGKGGAVTEKICRCPTNGRLLKFNANVEKWLPLTDSDRLVSDVSKLLSILIDVDEGAEKPSNTYTSEQQCSLERCSDVFDIYNIDYDPRTAKRVAEQLAKCLSIWHSART